MINNYLNVYGFTMQQLADMWISHADGRAYKINGFDRQSNRIKVAKLVGWRDKAKLDAEGFNLITKNDL